MPYIIRKKKNCYTVKNKKTKRVHSYCTTLVKAKKQVRLLNAIDHGFIPKRRKNNK